MTIPAMLPSTAHPTIYLTRKAHTTTARLDGAIDVTYYENGGILLTVMRRLMKA